MKLFAYGTLMTGECRCRLLEAAQVRSIRRASVRGSLRDCGDYPALVEGDGQVFGELLDCEALEPVLDALDEEEGPEFPRSEATVFDDTGAEHTAWIYRFSGDACGLPVITGGDWRLRHG